MYVVEPVSATYKADIEPTQNPLEWPPREITTQPTISSQPVEGQNKREAEALQAKQEAQALQKWLTTLQDWVREHAGVWTERYTCVESC